MRWVDGWVLFVLKFNMDTVSLTCLNANMMSLDNSISRNIPSNLLVKLPPHSK